MNIRKPKIGDRIRIPRRSNGCEVGILLYPHYNLPGSWRFRVEIIISDDKFRENESDIHEGSIEFID